MSLLQKARDFISSRPKQVAGAALVIAPLAAAAPCEAAVVFSDPQNSSVRWDQDGTSNLTAQYQVLNDGSLFKAFGGGTVTDSGTGGVGHGHFSWSDSKGSGGKFSGSVLAGDILSFSWDFTLTDVGAVPVTGVSWDLRFAFVLDSGESIFVVDEEGNGFGRFTGSRMHTVAAPANLDGFNLLFDISAVFPDSGDSGSGININIPNDSFDAVGPAAAAVPEPTAAVTWIMAAGVLALGRPRRRWWADRRIGDEHVARG